MNKFKVDPDIAKAKTLHTDFYTDPAVFQESKHKIFEKTIHFIGDMGMLPSKNFAVPFTISKDLINEPLLLLRDNNDNVKCFSNVCTHRGNLIVDKPCKARKLTCKYHGRRFDQSGKVEFMPEFKEVVNFPCEDDHLTELPIIRWGNLLFTSLNPNINESDFFSEMKKRMEFFPMDKLKRRDELSKEYFISANWALYCENYLEGFHIPFVHESLNQELDFSDYNTELYYPYSSLQLGVAKNNEHTFNLPETSVDYGKNIAAYYFWVFPNMMFNFYPWGLSINIVDPVSHDKTKVSFITYMYDESLYNFGAGGDLHRVELEDEEIVHNVQQGVQSRFYNQGRYSVTREKGTHHFHRLLASFISDNK